MPPLLSFPGSPSVVADRLAFAGTDAAGQDFADHLGDGGVFAVGDGLESVSHVGVVEGGDGHLVLLAVGHATEPIA